MQPLTRTNVNVRVFGFCRNVTFQTFIPATGLCIRGALLCLVKHVEAVCMYKSQETYLGCLFFDGSESFY